MTVYTDNFNRADEDPLGGNWTQGAWAAVQSRTIVLTSNQITRGGADPGQPSAYYNVGTIGSAQEVSFKYTGGGTFNPIEIGGRIVTPGASCTGYWLEAYADKATSLWYLDRMTSGRGTKTSLANAASPTDLNDEGCIIRFRGEEGVVSALVRPSTSSRDYKVIQVAESTYEQAGYGGVGALVFSTADDFEIKDLGADRNTSYVPQTFENYDSGTESVWTSLSNAQYNDGLFATTTTAGTGGNSDRLVCRNFGALLPTGATIKGIEIDIEYARTSPSIFTYVSISKDAGATPGNWSSLAVGQNTAGGPTDLWGLTLSKADVESANFSICVYVLDNGTAATADIDFAHITIFYSVGTAYPDADTELFTFTPSGLEGKVSTDSATLDRLLFTPATENDTHTIATPQTSRPASDISAGTWQPSSGVDLYAMLDEALVNDSDYIYSADSPVSADICEVALQPLTDPSTSLRHNITYRYAKNTASGDQIDLTVRLMQGAVEIASWQHSNISETLFTATQTLSGAEADSITDYSDLRLRFEAIKV